ncbi:MAG: aminotransferase class IV [Odoribacter sp.]|nr:aminotransferase class IV [Odoribacter sp.]
MQNKTLFIDTLKVENGKFIHPELHLQRIYHTQQEVFGSHTPLRLSDDLIPEEKRHGIVKCRITYDSSIRDIHFEFYHPRIVRSLKLVEGYQLDYHLKYADRYGFAKLLENKGKYDEILICRNGWITDTSYSNVVLFDGKNYFTPATYLLNGTKRQYLLRQGKIKEKDISIRELSRYQRLYLINAMIDIEDNISVDICRISPHLPHSGLPTANPE